MLDIKLSESILERYNSGSIGNEPIAELRGIPVIDNRKVINFKDLSVDIDKIRLEKFFSKFKLPESLKEKVVNNSNNLDETLLTEIGVHLYPYFSYGVLNGGSATSYVDSKKNRQFNNDLYSDIEQQFIKLSPQYKNRAKGITPAFVNPNGIPGPSFMELKMRALLLAAGEYRELTGNSTTGLFPMFQMTSGSNTDSIKEFYGEIKKSNYLKDLIKDTGIDITNVLTGVQPLITAFTHSSEGKVKSIFKDSNGDYLPMPGGHGQCFLVLKDIFQELYQKGIRFVSIGNVDNIGYTLDPKALALLAITGKQATFDFSFKTEFDVKGGVLINDQHGNMTCADLGVAVSKDDIKKAREDGKSILFNCATGMFNLEYLMENIDRIIEKLPMRFSDQSKDAGNYSQAEQVTWEVISILDDILILAVDKYERFLASKLLIENLVTSGVINDIKDESLKKGGTALNNGLTNLLKSKFNLRLEEGEWVIND